MESEGRFMDGETGDAAAALAAMRDARARLAATATCPPARHLVFGLLMGGIVACQAAPWFWPMVIEAVLMVGVVLVYLWDKRRTGMFINGYRPGRTRWVTGGLLIVLFGLGGVGVWLKFQRGLWQAPIVCGVVAAAMAAYGSVLWQRVWSRELRETP